MNKVEKFVEVIGTLKDVTSRVKVLSCEDFELFEVRLELTLQVWVCLHWWFACNVVVAMLDGKNNNLSLC